VKFTNSAWPLSSILLLLFGTGLVLMGLYFIFLRPPLLPEDLRYMAASQAQLESAAPHLTVWLTQVFRVMGGYVAATGVLTVTLAVTSFRLHEWAAAVGALLAGLASICWMATMNFMIDSDFKWVLLGAAILWACSIVLFWFERRGLVTAEAGKSDRAAVQPFKLT
jgi:hypothetical protein